MTVNVVNGKEVSVFNVVSQQYIALYDSGCKICLLEQTQAGIQEPPYKSTMPHMYMTPNPETFY